MITLSSCDNVVDYRMQKFIDKLCDEIEANSAVTLYWQTKEVPNLKDFIGLLSKFKIDVRQVSTSRGSVNRVIGMGSGIVLDSLMRAMSSEVAIWSKNGNPVDLVNAVNEFFKCLALTSTDERLVPVDFWHWNGRNAARMTKLIQCPKWEDIVQNYVPGVRAQISDLMSVKNPEEVGRVMLWHGDPGTGKTYAVRSLLQKWNDDYRPSVVVDPEVFFDNASYMYDVLLEERPDWDEDEDGEEYAGDGSDLRAKKKKNRGKLLIMEDMSDLLLKESRNEKGHCMARLLNLSDGILGQGLNAVYLFTTNQPLHEIDPAFTRPGRCLAAIKFEKFGSGQATEWLRAKNVDSAIDYDVTQAMTVAEMYALLHKKAPIGSSEDLEPKKIAGFAVGED